MNRFRLSPELFTSAPATALGGIRGGLISVGLGILNLAMNVGATVGFAVSGRSTTGRDFLIWQIIGSAFGLGTQLTFAGLVRYSSVQTASAVGIGLAFVAAEVVGAYKIFREPFSRAQWLGVVVVFAGLLLLSWGKR